MNRLALVALALVFSLQAHAAPASTASIEKTLDLMHAEQNMEAIWPSVEANMRQSMARAHAGSPATPEQQVVEERALKRALAAMRDQMNWQKMKPLYVKLYGDTFSQEEIDGLIVFYGTPAGQAYLAKVPLLMQHTMQLMQAELTELMPKMTQIMRETMQQGANAPATPQ